MACLLQYTHTTYNTTHACQRDNGSEREEEKGKQTYTLYKSSSQKVSFYLLHLYCLSKFPTYFTRNEIWRVADIPRSQTLHALFAVYVLPHYKR